LENHEGKEITAEELVDQYYADPDEYFEVRCHSAVGKSTTTAILNTSIELATP